MRRLVIGAAAGVLVALAAATGVSAYWQAQQTIPGEVVTSGDLAISADWLGGTPVWAALYPGQSTADAMIRVTSTNSGDNLAWKVRLTGAVPASFDPYATLQAWVGACGTGAPIPADGYGEFTSSTSAVDICVRYGLSASAPNTLQGQVLDPTITVTAEQVSP
ncbi:hypothetical protein [Microbacterium sp. A94]|uniref:hypothetical protein n=1 Tax=Microbacterium sp. A94 TaxID=3450717 RepID=UPI003F426187